MTSANTRARSRSRKGSTSSPAALGMCLSPYHVSTREAPAMLALTLGSSVTTLLPEPVAGPGRDAFADAAERSPRLVRLLESWRWCGPLWTAGIISGSADKESAWSRVGALYERIAADRAVAPLRGLTGSIERLKREDEYKALDALVGDILKGGPDPGVNVPFTAALDEFAGDHNLTAVRGAMLSVAQRAEAVMARRVCSFSMPILLRAGGGRLLMLRNELESSLNAIRAAVAHAFGAAEASSALTISEAARAYAREFTAWAEEGARGDDENDQRITWGYVGVACVTLPRDAALRSALAVVRTMGKAADDSAVPVSDAPRLPVMIVREMNARPESASESGK